MFKAFKEKVSNEYEKAKVNIQTQAQNLIVNNGTISNIANTINDNKLLGELSRSGSKNDMTTLGESSKNDSVKSEGDLHYSEPGFSLVDLDEETTQTPSHPPPAQVNTSTPTPSKVHSSADSDSFFRTNFFTSMVSNLVPQSDIESEYESESSSSRNLEYVSKEQLIELCIKLKDRGRKYKERWGEVVKAYRGTIEERDKLKNVLGETQDRALRRVNELKEQCQLEQEAKRHLEENLQVLIEERDEEIKVLKTKIELINTSGDSSSELIDLSAGEGTEEQSQKIANLEALLAKCNESLKSHKEKLDVITKEYEEIVPFKAQAEKLEKEVEYFKKLKESASASFAEAKQKLHDELESRSIIIKELKDQNEKGKIEVKKLANEMKAKNEMIKGLNEKVTKIESTVESEKSTLMEELSRGKVAAINLLREEYEKRIQASDSEWEEKLKAVTEQNQQLSQKLLTAEHSTNDEQSEHLQEQLNQQIAEAKAETVQLETQLTEVNDKLTSALEQLNANQLNYQAELETLHEEISKANQSAEEYRTKVAELSEQLTELNGLREKLQSTEQLLAEKELHRQEIGSEMEAVRNQLEERVQLIEKLTQEATTAEARVSELMVQLQQFEEQQRQQQQQQQQSSEQSTPVESELLQEMESRIETLKEKNRQKIGKIGELEKTLAAKDSEIVELISARSELEQEVSALKERMQSESSSVEATVTQLRADLEKSEKVLEVTKNLMNKLKEDNSTLQKEATELRKQCTELSEEKSRLVTELENLNGELTTSKQKAAESDRQNSVYLEEITKIKSNAKEILESKQKLKEKLTSGQEQERAQMEQAVQKLKTKLAEKEAEVVQLRQKAAELEEAAESSTSSQNDLIAEMEATLRTTNERCIELEEKLKMRTGEEQNLRTEIIALEERLKLTSKGEKELREDLRISGDVNNSLKEQVHKYLSEINDLKGEIEAIKGKHELAVDKLYKQLEVRESQLDESLMNANSQYNSTAQDLLKSKADVARLSKQLEELTAANRDLEAKLLGAQENSEAHQRKTIEQYEMQLEAMQAKLEQEKQALAEKMDQFDTVESRRIAEHKDLVARMETEIQEKGTALEEVHEYYQQRLKAKDGELKHLHEQLTSTDKSNYQINALQNSVLQYHEENARLKEQLSAFRQHQNPPTVDNGHKGTTNQQQSDLENCALLGLHLPQPTEYEYLRNILFEFMIGREPVTLAKVIAAVMRFSNDQTDQIVKKQEALQSHLKFNKPA
ncbi:Golga4p [Tyrophagus putrescentiae]|nr:Golga4p [Tyrophagus putrescentiae]